MKKNIPSFLMGIIATVLVFSLSIPVLAAAGLTITVNTDMKVQVNNQVFQPKDVNGNDVMVFEYQGTTYAPLRAIAEAYGLKVGYDPEKRMATVGESDDYESIPLEPNAVKDVRINLLKVKDKVYLLNEEPYAGINYTIIKNKDETLLFTYDICVNTHNPDWSYLSSWEFNSLFRFALLEEFEIKETENPYVDGLICIKKPTSTIDEIFTVGVEEKKYTSPSEYYIPMWIEKDGKRLYSHDVKVNGLHEINGIRYFGDKICINDVFEYYNINKTINIGLYHESYYIEVY